jgi:hypothetical protein
MHDGNQDVLVNGFGYTNGCDHYNTADPCFCQCRWEMTYGQDDPEPDEVDKNGTCDEGIWKKWLEAKVEKCHLKNNAEMKDECAEQLGDHGLWEEADLTGTYTATVTHVNPNNCPACKPKIEWVADVDFEGHIFLQVNDPIEGERPDPSEPDYSFARAWIGAKLQSYDSVAEMKMKGEAGGSIDFFARLVLDAETAGGHTVERYHIGLPQIGHYMPGHPEGEVLEWEIGEGPMERIGDNWQYEAQRGTKAGDSATVWADTDTVTVTGRNPIGAKASGEEVEGEKGLAWSKSRYVKSIWNLSLKAECKGGPHPPHEQDEWPDG